MYSVYSVYPYTHYTTYIPVYSLYTLYPQVPAADISNQGMGALVCDKVKWINAVNAVLDTMYLDLKIHVVDQVVCPDAANGTNSGGNLYALTYALMPYNPYIPYIL